MNAAKDCTLQEKLLRCAMALILAAGALLASVAASPAYAAPSTVDVSIGGKIPYGGFATTWMSADGNIAYCAEPSSPTPAPGSYSTSPVPSGDVTAAIWYSFGSPGFDASMFPSSWYDGGGWDDAKYAAASHVLIAYAYSGSESAATHGTSAEFASWAKSELIGGTFAKMKAGAGKVSAGFEAFCVRTGGGSQTLVSFSWSTGGVKVAKADSEAGAEPQGDASLDGASFSVVNETGRYVLVGGKYYADGDQVIEAGKAKVVDTVAYKGLVPGETYIAVGMLMDKGTGEPFLDKDGNEVTARTPFEPEAPSGTVEVTFEFDTEGLAEGDELVVFEKVLGSAGNVVAAHEDIDSAEQSVVVDNPDTPEVPEEPYAKTGADAPDGTGYAVAAGIALAAAAGAGGALAYRKRKAAASKDEAAEKPEE